MEKQQYQSNALLLLTAMIWGFAFVAQRVGMDYVGPFTFNAIRFFLGGCSLIPLLLLSKRRQPNDIPHPSTRTVILGSCLSGLVLFLGASLQQVGVVSTTAGKAGFITGLYVVLVPLAGLLWKQQTSKETWLGALLAIIGLYLLSVNQNFRIARGDLLVLLGAFCWTGHVHIIDWLSTRIRPITLACYQFFICAGLSMIVAIFTESLSATGLQGALLPILYGGFMSVGIAYTLQVVAQRNAHPAHAAIIMSLEAVFAMIGGLLLLGETLSLRGGVGSALMLTGMIFSQLSK